MTAMHPRISVHLAGLPPASYGGAGTPESVTSPMARAFRLVVDGLAYNGAEWPDGQVVLDLGGHGLHALDGGVEELLAMNPGGRIEWADVDILRAAAEQQRAAIKGFDLDDHWAVFYRTTDVETLPDLIDPEQQEAP